MRNIKLVIEYIGANYNGYQKQPKGKTIQGCLEKALQELFNEEITTYASGRTDAGVNALGQVVNFTTNATMPADKMAIAINHHLPGDIRVVSSEQVYMNFNSRFSAKSKTYIYKICTSEQLSVFDNKRYLHYPYPIDLELLKQACQKLVGKHDFSSFMSTGGPEKLSTIRTIYDAHVDIQDNYITFEITGNGFLYNMVRIIVGTILEIARGKKKLDVFEALYQGNCRNLAGKTVEPYALYLKQVNY